MKKIILTIICVILPLIAGAQGIKFAYFSYDEVLKAMPEYTTATKSVAELRAKYDAELKRAEDDFNSKYEDFLDGQRSFAPSILRKRQAELQDIMDKNIAFKREVDRLLKQAEADAYTPVKRKLDTVLREMGRQAGYAFIINTDNNSLSYANPAMGENITDSLKAALR